MRVSVSVIAETTAILQQLPDDVLGVHFDKRSLAAFWMETNTVAQAEKRPRLAIFWPTRKSKVPSTLEDFPRLKHLRFSHALPRQCREKALGCCPELVHGRAVSGGRCR